MSMMEQQNSQGGWTTHTITFFGKRSRSIILAGEVNHHTATGITSQIQELAAESPDDPIILYINTHGGSILDGLAIYDMLLLVPCPIVTIVNGACLSVGLLIAAAGDIRYATPNSLYFYHQPALSGMVDISSSNQINSMQKFYSWCKDKTDELMRTRIKMSKKTWLKEFGENDSKYFDAKQAIDYGFATHILEYETKRKIKHEEL
jgi:ATP-dependent Clp protease protease subunit